MKTRSELLEIALEVIESIERERNPGRSFEEHEQVMTEAREWLWSRFGVN